MATTQPMIIKCTEPKIHRPKPKRINKKSNIIQFNKKYLYNINRQIKPKNPRINNIENKKNMKYFINNEKNRNISFNLDVISLEEMENDFKEFKSKNEEIEVQRELITLIIKAERESCRNECNKNCPKIRRPQKPFYINNEL